MTQNNMTGHHLNKLIITFSKGKEEVFHYPDKIVTKLGKTFETLKVFIEHYKNEEKERENKLLK